MKEREEDEILGFVRSIRDEVRDIDRLVRQGVISREEYMNIKARSDEGDTTITEDEKTRIYDLIMYRIDDIELYAKVVLGALKRGRIGQGQKGEKRDKVL